MKIMNNIKFLSIDFDPLKGVNPSFSMFGGALDGKINDMIALVLACAFLYAAFCLIQGIARSANGRRVGDSELFASGRKEVGFAVVSLVLLSMIDPLYQALVK